MVHGLLDIVQKSQYTATLNGDPDITFFKVVFTRYTPFSREFRSDYFTGNTSWGSELTCEVTKIGDLLYRGYIVLDVSISLPSVLKAYFSNGSIWPNVISELMQLLPLSGDKLTGVRQMVQAILPGYNVDSVILSEFPGTLEEVQNKYDTANLYIDRITYQLKRDIDGAFLAEASNASYTLDD